MQRTLPFADEERCRLRRFSFDGDSTFLSEDVDETGGLRWDPPPFANTAETTATEASAIFDDLGDFSTSEVESLSLLSFFIAASASRTFST